MSINAIGSAMQLDLPAAQKWLLVCLADHADPYGANCYPSVATLCAKACMTERTVRRNLRLLEQRRLLVRDTNPQTISWISKRGIATTVYRLPFVNTNHYEPPHPKVDNSSCPPALKAEIIRAFARTCVYCERAGTETHGPDGFFWTVDRIVPGSRGGGYGPENVTLSCRHCNTKKGAKMAPAAPVSLAVMRGPSETTGGAKAYARMAPKPYQPGSESTRARKRARTEGLRSLGDVLNEAQRVAAAR